MLSRDKSPFAGQEVDQIIHPQLVNELELVNDDDKTRVIIKLQAKAPGRQSEMRKAEDQVNLLKEVAQEAQKPIIDFLSKGIHTQSQRRYKSFWLTNIIFAELTRKEILEIAALPGIEKIYQEITIHVFPDENSTRTVDWDHLGLVKAPEVWAKGYQGQQVKVAVLDTGVDINHPELRGALGGEPPYYPGYWVEMNEDGNPVTNSKPHDTVTHGTHVSGTVLGRNVNMLIGMAPQAVLGHALILPNGGGTLPQVIAGLQWAIDQGFQIVNGSWGVDDLIPDLAEAVANMADAGVLPVFAVGNAGPEVTSSPGNSPEGLAVGAFGPDGQIASFSGGGNVQYPEYSYSDTDEQLKPDIAAPGVEITSCIPGGEYAAYSGTSMATPHVAGAAALLLSKNPNLTVNELKNILYKSVGGMVGMLNDPDGIGKDIRYGWGRLNVLQAIELVEEVGAVGTVQGYIQANNEFIEEALIKFEGPAVKTMISDAHGFYRGSLLEGTYLVIVSVPGYQDQKRHIEVISGESELQNFVLEPVAES